MSNGKNTVRTNKVVSFEEATKEKGQKTFAELQSTKKKELLHQEKKGEIYKKFKNIFSDGELLDVGTYTWENPDNKYAGVEIPGDQEYIIWNDVQVMDVHDGLICLTAEGEFFNPYIQRSMTVSMTLENFPIGQDITSTPYGYLIN